MSTRQYTYPHSIENGAGERMTFVRRSPNGAGDRLEIQHVVSPGSGPPMHVHHLQEESFTIEQGRLTILRPGEHPAFAEVGETVVFPPGDVHRFRNDGPVDVVCSGHFEPADNIEYFLGGIYASMRSNDGKRPGLFDGAFLSRRYRTEFAITEIPAPVQRFVFPVVETLGRLLGKYRGYADAPEPVGKR